MLTFDAFSQASGPDDIKARAKVQTCGDTTHWRVVVQPRAQGVFNAHKSFTVDRALNWGGGGSNPQAASRAVSSGPQESGCHNPPHQPTSPLLCPTVNGPWGAMYLPYRCACRMCAVRVLTGTAMACQSVSASCPLEGTPQAEGPTKVATAIGRSGIERLRCKSA